MQLTIQGLRILPLLLVHRKPVLPKDDVVPHRQSEQRGSTCRYLSPTQPTLFIQTHDRTRLLCYRARLARTSHTELSTTLTLPTVKWKTPSRKKRTYFIPPPRGTASPLMCATAGRPPVPQKPTLPNISSQPPTIRTLSRKRAPTVRSNQPWPTPVINQFHPSASSAKGLARCNPLFPPNSTWHPAPDRFRNPSPARP